MSTAWLILDVATVSAFLGIVVCAAWMVADRVLTILSDSGS